MNACELFDSADVEMYFYGELDPADRVRVGAHLRGCEPCRQRLDDLHAIRHALASRPVVDAPPAGDWSGFMRRLDAAVAEAAEPSSLRTFEPARRLANANSGTVERLEPLEPEHLLALAAMLALVTIGVLVAMRARPRGPGATTVRSAPHERRPPPTPATARRPAAPIARCAKAAWSISNARSSWCSAWPRAIPVRAARDWQYSARSPARC